MNYGHPLQFGTFITPVNSPPAAAVELAQLSEQLGYDLVTFQDHPYQPGFLDTWTLMAWVAGKSERIQISANVLNLPMRPPAVTARASASLDLLSNGRFQLALGAGAFWDAMEAMGATRLSPGESVEALSESIDIIREFWSSDRGPIRYTGDHYRLDGAKRGPEPGHEIPLWVGGVGPRMLRLIGEKADGWLPSLRRMKPGQFAESNRVIDEAAEENGRDPREIRRLVNISGTFGPTHEGFLAGTASDWVDDLLPLVIDQGVGTFILMSDDPTELRRFAEDVVPALRDAVDRELPELSGARRVRRASVRSRRRDGIDYDNLPIRLAERAIEPGDVGYGSVRSTYLRGGSPGLVLRPTNTAEVVEAIGVARLHADLPLGIRSAGHGISGRSTNDGGLVIDVSAMNGIEILDVATRRVRIGPGARWMDVAAALHPYGWALSSGDYGGVGVGGLATAGGIGFMGRQHGLTIDHLRAAELVLADGTVMRASETENSDLFWAIRGAGANFGILTSFEFEVDAVGDVGWANLALDAGDTAGFLTKWGATVEAAPRDTTSFLTLGAPRDGQPAIAQVTAMVDSDEPDVVIDRLQPFANISRLYDQSVRLMPYADVMANAQQAPHDGRGQPVSRSGLLRHITPEFAAVAAQMILSGAVYFFQIRAVGGAIADVDPDATAYAHRSANFSVVAFGSSRERLAPLWDELHPFFDGLYLSFESDLHPQRIHDAFPPKTLKRLRELKRRYDPDNLFRDNFNIVNTEQDRGVAHG